MKAVVQDRYGPPEVLRVEEVERPVPKDDEFLIRVRASTVSQSDTHARQPDPFLWRLAFGLRRPRLRTLGVELAGEVEAVGAAVREFKVGDEVFGKPSSYFGAHAEYVCASERAALALKPVGISFDEAAAVCDGASQATRLAAKSWCRRGAPDRRLWRVRFARHGGRAAGQALRRPRHGRLRDRPRRARPVARCRRGRRLPPAGLHEERPDLRRDHRRCRQVLVPSRPARAEAGRDLRRHRWRALPARDAGLLSWRPGSSAASGSEPAIGRRIKQDVLFFKELIESGEFRAVVDRRYPMDQVVEAHRYVETWHKAGNVVLTIATDPPELDRTVAPTK